MTRAITIHDPVATLSGTRDDPPRGDMKPMTRRLLARLERDGSVSFSTRFLMGFLGDVADNYPGSIALDVTIEFGRVAVHKS